MVLKHGENYVPWWAQMEKTVLAWVKVCRGWSAVSDRVWYEHLSPPQSEQRVSFRARFSSVRPRSGEVRTQNLKSHLVRTQSLNGLPLKPGVGQYIAIYATLTARNFFFAYFYPSGPFTCIFPKPLPISPVLAVANTRFLCRPAQ